MTEQATKTRRRWYAQPLFIAGVAVVILGVGVGTAVALGTRTHGKDSGLTKLAKSDGSGAAACDYLAQWIQGKVVDPGTGKPYGFVVVSVAVSVEAANSTTPAIKATVSEPVMDSQTLALLQANSTAAPGNSRVTNLTSLYQACAGAGVAMPPFSEIPN